MDARAIVASRDGELRTVNTDEADRLIAAGGWMIVCREPEGATLPVPSAPGLRALRLDVKHRHNYGNPDPDGTCPKSESLDVPDSLDRWTTNTLADITERAAAMLDAPRLSWKLRSRDTTSGNRKYEIEITPHSENGKSHHTHAVIVTLPGFPSFAVAELLRHLTFTLEYTYGINAGLGHRRPRTPLFLSALRRIREQLDKLDDELDDLEGNGGVGA